MALDPLKTAKMNYKQAECYCYSFVWHPLKLSKFLQNVLWLKVLVLKLHVPILSFLLFFYKLQQSHVFFTRRLISCAAIAPKLILFIRDRLTELFRNN